MVSPTVGVEHASEVSASWLRCKLKHNLTRDSARPSLRLQSSEVSPRLECMLDRLSGGDVVLRQLSQSIAGSGHCLVVADEAGIAVRLDGHSSARSDEDWNGIGLGSCWGESVAGTNGVSMAMLQKRSVVVRGKDHFFSKLAHFSCTAVPLLDAANRMIGVLNLSAIDRGKTTDYLFAKHLLDSAADRIQRHLFEARFKQDRIIALSVPSNAGLFRSDEWIAVDDHGLILGSTAKAHALAGVSSAEHMVGEPFGAVFQSDLRTIEHANNPVSVSTGSGISINARVHERRDALASVRVGSHKRQSRDHDVQRILRRPPVLQELAIGSDVMAAQCRSAKACFESGVPFVIEGASATGKSALVDSLCNPEYQGTGRFLTVDCATLDDGPEDRQHFRSLMEQAKAVDALTCTGSSVSTLVFENVNELPRYAQAELRKLLGELERGGDSHRAKTVSDLRIISTSRGALIKQVESNAFRDDLYFLLSGSVVQLPSVALRERREELIQSLADRVFGDSVEIAKDALRALTAEGWPGNVRQMSSVLKVALREGCGHKITLSDLHAAGLFPSEQNVQEPSSVASTENPDKAVAYEQAMLLDSLEKTGWNISKAARLLGIGRATVHRKIKKLRIKRPT